MRKDSKAANISWQHCACLSTVKGDTRFSSISVRNRQRDDRTLAYAAEAGHNAAFIGRGQPKWPLSD